MSPSMLSIPGSDYQIYTRYRSDSVHATAYHHAIVIINPLVYAAESMRTVTRRNVAVSNGFIDYFGSVWSRSDLSGMCLPSLVRLPI